MFILSYYFCNCNYVRHSQKCTLLSSREAIQICTWLIPKCYKDKCHWFAAAYLLSWSWWAINFITYRGGGSSFRLVKQIGQACMCNFNFHLSILIYSCDLLMIIGLTAAWSAWPVPPPLTYESILPIMTIYIIFVDSDMFDYCIAMLCCSWSILPSVLLVGGRKGRLQPPSCYCHSIEKWNLSPYKCVLIT